MVAVARKIADKAVRQPFSQREPHELCERRLVTDGGENCLSQVIMGSCERKLWLGRSNFLEH
jgi:hypothetical protein